jgi:pimeloyl-ACP methyl ester carboxylesterase
MKRKYFRWIKLIVLVYALLGIALYYLQDRILFHPAAFAKDKKYDLPYSFREMNIPYDKETNLNIIQFYPVHDSVTRGVVLYFHGNRQNIAWYAKQAINFTSKNYEVWMMDYPGFGKSTGVFTEKRLYDYALQLYKLARTHYAPAQIILYGKSMGTGIASQLASVRDCKYLLLEAPYYSMTALASHFFPIYPVGQLIHYRFPVNEYLLQVTAPVVIFHGSSDWIIPYAQASRLIASMKPTDEFVTIEKGSHNDLDAFPLFHQKLDSLLSH